MFWIVFGIISSLTFLTSAFVLYIIGCGLQEIEREYNNGYENPFE